MKRLSWTLLSRPDNERNRLDCQRKRDVVSSSSAETDCVFELWWSWFDFRLSEWHGQRKTNGECIENFTTALLMWRLFVMLELINIYNCVEFLKCMDIGRATCFWKATELMCVEGEMSLTTTLDVWVMFWMRKTMRNEQIYLKKVRAVLKDVDTKPSL